MGDLVQATPTNGDVRHAVPLGPRHGFRNDLVFSRALCGVRGRNAWGGGGMQLILNESSAPVPFTAENALPATTGWNGKNVNLTCPKCLAKVKRPTPESHDDRTPGGSES